MSLSGCKKSVRGLIQTDYDHIRVKTILSRVWVEKKRRQTATMECAFEANAKQLYKPSSARIIYNSSCLCRLRSYRWCFDNLHFVAVADVAADTNTTIATVVVVLWEK